jgi:hypothetical protein
MKIRPLGAELLHADGRTERQTDSGQTLQSCNRFSQFCEHAKKNYRLILHREVIARCSKNHAVHVNTLCEQKAGFSMLNPAARTVNTGL